MKTWSQQRICREGPVSVLVSLVWCQLTCRLAERLAPSFYGEDAGLGYHPSFGLSGTRRQGTMFVFGKGATCASESFG